MGCDSQFDFLYDSPKTNVNRLTVENARLKAELAQLQDHLAGKSPDARGYDTVRDFLVCRFDRTVTDSMDAHDTICTRPKPQPSQTSRSTT